MGLSLLEFYPSGMNEVMKASDVGWFIASPSAITENQAINDPSVSSLALLIIAAREWQGHQ